jgi:amino acid transporter
MSVPATTVAPGATDPPRPELERVIGVGGVAFTSFNCIVGVGIFALPALVASLLGTASILAYGACLVLIALVGLCFAEAGSRVPASGGMYAYAEAAFGPVAGGVSGVLMVFGNSVGSSAALARFFLDTLGNTWPVFAHPVAGIALLALIYVVLASVNIWGTRDSSRLTVVIGIVKLVPLIALVTAGVFAIKPANLAWSGLPPGGKIGEAALILVFAFIGVESGLNVSGETRNPTRTIPRAIALALGMVAVLYIGLQMSAQGVLGSALATSSSPLVDTANAIFGSSIARLFVALTLFSAGGYLVADMLSSPRIFYALAQVGHLPRWMGYVHPRRHTPAAGIILYAAFVVIVTASGTFRQIAVLAVAGTLLLYLITCLAVLRLRAKGTAATGSPFVAPGGAVVPLLASGIIVWLLSTLAWRELITTAVFVGVATALYAIRHRFART